tara:strand:+ start:1289 stop:1819 length:531 start_codon:yes stop_codon:yes gene_type:complete
MFLVINLIIIFLSGYLLMIQSNLEKLVYRINNYVNNSPHLFNTNFNIKIFLNIENKTIFRQGFCGAITAGGHQCSRKNKPDSIFCGLHRCDKYAHKRKRTKTINYLDTRDNQTSSVYEIIFQQQSNNIELFNMTKLAYKTQHYLLDTSTNILYLNTNKRIIELGDFYGFNYNFQYI